MSTELLRELFELNCTCCDCSKANPSFANLAIGSFVCLECASLLRELGFPIKGLAFSKFTSEEIRKLGACGGNERVNAIYLGTRPTTPQRERIADFRDFLMIKYIDKMWYDADMASRATYEPQVQPKTLFSMSPISWRRKTRANSNNSGTNTEEEKQLESGRQEIKQQIERFYRKHNPDKLHDVDTFTDWAMFHGLDEFNRKLRNKYGVDLRTFNQPSNSNPFDIYLTTSATPRSNNPFDEYLK